VAAVAEALLVMPPIRAVVAVVAVSLTQLSRLALVLLTLSLLVVAVPQELELLRAAMAATPLSVLYCLPLAAAVAVAGQTLMEVLAAVAAAIRQEARHTWLAVAVEWDSRLLLLLLLRQATLTLTQPMGLVLRELQDLLPSRQAVSAFSWVFLVGMVCTVLVVAAEW
jgi:hypothetical protein